MELLFSADSQIPATAANPSSTKDQLYAFLGQYIRQHDRREALLLVCGFLIVAIMVKSGARWLNSYFISPFEQGVITEMRKHIFRHLTRLDIAFYTRRKKGDLLSILVSDVQEIQDAVLGTFQSTLRDPLSLITVLITLFVLSWKLSLFTLILLPVTGLFISLISKKLKRRANRSQEALGELIAIADEAISGMRVVKAYQKEGYVREKYQHQNKIYSDLLISVRRRSSLASPVTEVLAIMVVCIIILYGGSLILNGQGELRGSEFVGFILVFSQFINPVRDLSTSITRIQKGMASWERVDRLLSTPIEIKKTANPVRINGFEDKLQFEHVWFRYEDEWVLRDVSFSVEKGKTVALVGASGSGKSTSADLILRFYDPQQGRITLDGHDLRDLLPGDLRARIGYVSQEAVLFHDTVLNNIAFGLRNVDEAAVIEAAKAANAHEFIAKLPNGYHTLIGERGTMLSGGQRQRLSIARAILRNPAILILDEATSNLDNESEKLVQEALSHLMASRTSLVIAHRLSTIQHADQILVMDKGQVVETGTHTELLAQNGVYARLYETGHR